MAEQEKFTLTVRHSVTAHEEDALNETGYLVSYDILDTNIPDLPTELFLFRQVASQRIDQEPHFYDNFITVCTLSDVFEYPANVSDCDKQFYRKSSIRGILPSLTEANRVLLRIEDLLTSLIRSIKLIHNSAVEVERIIAV